MNEKYFDFCTVAGNYVTKYENSREFLTRAYEKYSKVIDKIKVKER